MERNFNESEIFKSANPAQKILWNYIFLKFGQNIAVGQFFYQGLHSAAIYNTYNARRLFICYQLTISGYNTLNTGFAMNTFYDENNSVNLYLNNGTAHWDTTGAYFRISNMPVHIENIIFSRVLNPYAVYSRFIGFILGI